ncbi:MAG: hypothetical protein HC783_00830 [Rhodobacteraceae bacterium]|nr:hypothetical protein [Paracoccaceae bacterium]
MTTAKAFCTKIPCPIDCSMRLPSMRMSREAISGDLMKIPCVAPPPGVEITSLLGRWHGGEPDALAELLPVVYGELRRLARRALGDGVTRNHDRKAVDRRHRVEEFCRDDDVLRLDHVDAVRQRLAGQVGVDQRDHAAGTPPSCIDEIEARGWLAEE